MKRLYSADMGENRMKNQLQLEQIWQIISSRSLSRYNDQKTCNKQLIVVYQMGVFCAFPLFRFSALEMLRIRSSYF